MRFTILVLTIRVVIGKPQRCDPAQCLVTGKPMDQAIANELMERISGLG